MADIIRVSLTGTMPGGEKWSVNPTFALTTGAVITASEALAAVVAINAVSVPTQLRAIMSSGTALTGCRVEARTFAGDLQAQAEGLRGTPATGTSGTGMPFQTSLVISLRSLAPGARGRGRLYWPATAAVIDPSTLRVSVAGVAALLTDAKTYLTNVQTALDGVVDETVALAVWSRTALNASPVASIRIGDVLDTQRRRRDSLPETYQSTAYTGALTA